MCRKCFLTLLLTDFVVIYTFCDNDCCNHENLIQGKYRPVNWHRAVYKSTAIDSDVMSV